MASATMATAAGAAVLLYIISRRILAAKDEDEDGDRESELSRSRRSASVKRRLAGRTTQAPATWFEAITTLSETLKFTYAETLGKWPIGDLAFGINYLMRNQGNVQVASAYAAENCIQLKGPEIIAELNQYLRLLTFCILFSKKPFPVFLESAGYEESDVLLQKPKAALLKPAFTILCDRSSKCLLLLIRGTHSIKDTLTAATGTVVPFHHSVLHDGGISNLILGYAHCGMVAAARWIAKLSTPCLLKALDENPDYNVQIVGHSLGGGTAALLTYILREHKEFASSTCVTFAPAACMTWDLAESGQHFITTVINGSDLVPTFSSASVDDLRSEVTASSWSNDLRDQVARTRVLNVVFRSATALGSRLPSIASAKARVVGAGALLRPVSSGTQGVIKRAQNVAQAVVKTRSSLSSWTCMGARRRTVGPTPNSKEEDLTEEAPLVIQRTSESLVAEVMTRDPTASRSPSCSSSDGSGHDDSDEEEHGPRERIITTSTAEDMTEGELWYELERELQKNELQARAHAQDEEEAAAAEEIVEDEKGLVESAESKHVSTSDIPESHRFYPPGRTLHIVAIQSSETTEAGEDGLVEERIGIYQTPRDLYSKLRLSRTMINDHYMPMYKRMMERLISELEKEEEKEEEEEEEEEEAL